MYFLHYSRVIMVLFSTSLYKPVFSTYHFMNLGFCLSVFWFFVLYLWIFTVFLCFEINFFLEDFITFIKSASIINYVLFNFVLLVLTLYKSLLKRKNCVIKKHIYKAVIYTEKFHSQRKICHCHKSKITYENLKVH